MALAMAVVAATIVLRDCRTTESVGPARPLALPSPTPWPLAAELTRDGAAWRLEIRGEPGASILVVQESIPRHLVTLDDEGRGGLSHLAVDGDAPTLELIPLAGTATRVAAADRPAPPEVPTVPGAATPTATPGAARDADGRIRVEELPFVPRPTATPRPDSTEKQAEAPAPAAPATGPSPPLLHLVTDAGPRIAITFDGSSSTDGTANLLDLLHDLGLEVTLFVTGEFIDANPAVVRRALLAGHEIGSHSYSHPHLTTYAANRRHDLATGVDREMLHRELRRTEEAFRRATGRPMTPLWRAPFGEENGALRAWAFELGYLHVRWSSLEGASLDSLDWVEDEHSSLYRDSRRMMQRLLRFPRLEGGIALMHLATRRTEPPWEALPSFVAEVRRRGLEPVRVTQLLDASPTWRPWLERAAENHHRTFGPGMRAPREESPASGDR